ncbi:MAG: hypothetical protein JWN41_1491 [Thermoleophilia bacterium]|nr:hypothetical protein [Thermoleophilia bacterium]
MAAWYGVIFWFSSRPDLRVADDDLLDFIVRKLGHCFVFAVLALLCLLLVGSWARARPLAQLTGAHFAMAWLLTLAFAATDEWHQTFVRGRVGHAQDVGIDMLGATVAMLTVGLVARRRRAAA